MIIIYRINDDNVKSVDDLTYFYYSILTANAYLDGEIRIYTTFNYYDFFAHLPFNFYPDYRDEKTFIKEVIESLDDEHIYVNNSKIIFHYDIIFTNHMKIMDIFIKIDSISKFLLNKLINNTNNNNIILIK